LDGGQEEVVLLALTCRLFVFHQEPPTEAAVEALRLRRRVLELGSGLVPGQEELVLHEVPQRLRGNDHRRECECNGLQLQCWTQQLG